MAGGEVKVVRHDDWVQVVLNHPGKFNAMSRSMWRELRQVFATLQEHTNLRCVLLSGANGHFCAGGDISEYPDFRFQPETLRSFHEEDVWGALQCMLDCDVPIVARIDGNCMGAGVEIASCCDVRLGAASSRYGAPIARLGFPMAEKEAALVSRAVGDSVARAMLLGAEVFDANRMLQCGFLTHCVDDQRLEADAMAFVVRQVQLAPLATRAHKRMFRALSLIGCHADEAQSALNSVANESIDPYAYADSPEHREGIEAFLQKRKPRFSGS
ncbi:enoyl-CoA hydratase/isomerase family protein [Curvibacter sp. APW13]|uniref:enoyl-CoA hydratase/isomerase family protein n=1 Tax=Curvibacter sp. APW13 TaxID=3077236 RepID=UPI0028DE7D28|nr:enoyl-CoA hydratase/isomerase family protein [Curvibacter sp. APW13]MDT8991243.1 enoyl-CoA hydratase/isomerase family protein [Curvibacter sp. APW13]